MAVDLRKEYVVRLGRWERYECMVTVKAVNGEQAKRLARKAARSIDWDGFDGEGEPDNLTPPKIENDCTVEEIKP